MVKIKDLFSQFNHQYQERYDFHDLDKNSDVDLYMSPDEGFTFANFNSADKGWWLTKRDAPTPKEKEITYSVPYSQGEEDFSNLDNQRFFEAREITYELLLVDEDYSYRKAKEKEIKRLIMQAAGYRELDDTFNSGFCFSVKSESVECSDDESNGTLTATVKFKAYPYAIAKSYEGSDIWDEINFDNWQDQQTTFEVNNNSLKVDLDNYGSKPVELSFAVTGKVKVTGSNINLDLNQAEATKVTVMLPVGVTNLTLSGSGTIHFQFKREEMI